MSRLKESYTILLGLYILTSLVIPLAVYNKIIFVIMMLIYAGYVIRNKKINWITFSPVIIILIFFVGFCRGVANDADINLARQFLFITFSFLLIFPINEFGIDLNELLKKLTPIYLIISYIYVIYAFNIWEYEVPDLIPNIAKIFDSSILRGFGEMISELGSGCIEYRSFFEAGKGKGIMIHLGSVPFLLLLVNICFIDFLKSKKIRNIVWIALSMVLAVLSTSRALMLLIAASISLLLLLNLERRKRMIAMITIAIAGALGLMYLLFNSTFFSFEEMSNAVKIGHLLSFLEQMTMKKAFIGEGLATHYYSSGLERYVAHTEITLLDYCRYFGIPLAIMVYYALIFPQPNKKWIIWKIEKEEVALLMYLVLSMTNPVLFNSFGIVVVLWYWNVTIEKNKEGKSV